MGRRNGNWQQVYDRATAFIVFCVLTVFVVLDFKDDMKVDQFMLSFWGAVGLGLGAWFLQRGANGGRGNGK